MVEHEWICHFSFFYCGGVRATRLTHRGDLMLAILTAPGGVGGWNQSNVRAVAMHSRIASAISLRRMRRYVCGDDRRTTTF